LERIILQPQDQAEGSAPERRHHHQEQAQPIPVNHWDKLAHQDDKQQIPLALFRRPSRKVKDRQRFSS
jgi:hypothetical protein